MEDNSLAEQLTGYYNNLTATCIDTAGQGVAMGVRIDPHDGSQLVCELAEQAVCELSTTYKVSDCKCLTDATGM